MNEPAVKMLLAIKKEYLVIKAKNYELDPTGTKLELARRVAKYEEEKEQRAWKAIANSPR
jgi:hypothetical protein